MKGDNMKIMNKITHATTKAIGNMYSAETIAKKSQGSRNGESMMKIYSKIMSDPAVSIVDGKLIMHGKEIGWIDTERCMGWIDEKAYAQVAEIPDIPEDIDDNIDYEYDETIVDYAVAEDED